jgi:hypothetical protein
VHIVPSVSKVPATTSRRKDKAKIHSRPQSFAGNQTSFLQN